MDLKEPYLEQTDMKLRGDKEDTSQNVENVLRGVEQKLAQLYDTIKSILLNGGTVPPGSPLTTNTVFQVFEREGVFTALQKDPSLREAMLNSLNVSLKEYPYTRSKKHIHTLQRLHTPSHQTEVIPNTVDADKNQWQK